MRSPAKVLSFTALLAVAALTAFAVPACSNQSEGGVCDLQTDQDCQDGLVCTGTAELNQVEVTTEADRFKGRCCPTNRATATVAICQIPEVPRNADPTVPADAGGADVSVPETSTPEAGGEVPDAGGSDAADEGG